MPRVTEEIILKIGVDTGGLESEVGGAEDALGDLEDQVEDYTGAAKEAEKESEQLGDAFKNVKLDADKLFNPINNAEDSLDKFTASVKRNAAETKKSKESRANFIKGLRSIRVPALAAAAAIGVVIKRTLENEVRQIQMAKALGVSAQRLRDLQGLSEQFGATAEDVVQGIKNISEISTEALRAGSGERFELFKEINIDLKEFDKLSPDQKFIEFSRALNNVTNQGRKTEIQLALMQEEGFKLANTMEVLATEGEGALDKVRELGGEINVQQVQELNKKWAEFNLTMRGIISDLVSGVTPAIENILISTKATLSFFKDIGFAIGAFIEGTNTWQLQLEDINNELNKTVAIVEGKDLASQLYGPEAQEAERKRKEGILKIVQLTESLRRAQDKARREELEKEKAKNAKIEEQRIKQEQREKNFARRKQQREDKARKDAINSIRAIGLERLKDRLKELKVRERVGGVVSAVEVGTSEAARLEAQRRSVNPALRGQIARIEATIAEEEKRLEQEKLKTAQDSLKELKKISKDSTVIKTKTIK
jgi:hypothetical protein